MKMTNKFLRVNTDFTTELLQLDADPKVGLKQLQDAVGGWVQSVPLANDLSIWLNEEGKFSDMKMNTVATMLWTRFYGMTDFVVGDVLFAGGPDAEGETNDISASWIHEIETAAANMRDAAEGKITVSWE
jgi:hypothetical protein